MPATSIIPDGEPANATDAALNDFRRLMWTFHDLARSAGKIETLPASYKTLAACIVKLSGLRPHLGAGRPADAKARAENLEHVALAVDPLLEALGAEADLIKSALYSEARMVERA